MYTCPNCVAFNSLQDRASPHLTSPYRIPTHLIFRDAVEPEPRQGASEPHRVRPSAGAKNLTPHAQPTIPSRPVPSRPLLHLSPPPPPSKLTPMTNHMRMPSSLLRLDLALGLRVVLRVGGRRYLRLTHFHSGVRESHDVRVVTGSGAEPQPRQRSLSRSLHGNMGRLFRAVEEV